MYSIYEFEATIRSLWCKCQNLACCYSGIVGTRSGLCYNSGYLKIYNSAVLQMTKAAEALCLQEYQHLTANYPARLSVSQRD